MVLNSAVFVAAAAETPLIFPRLSIPMKGDAAVATDGGQSIDVAFRSDVNCSARAFVRDAFVLHRWRSLYSSSAAVACSEFGDDGVHV